MLYTHTHNGDDDHAGGSTLKKGEKVWERQEEKIGF